jgi:hypothetical protein
VGSELQLVEWDLRLDASGAPGWRIVREFILREAASGRPLEVWVFERRTRRRGYELIQRFAGALAEEEAAKVERSLFRESVVAIRCSSRDLTSLLEHYVQFPGLEATSFAAGVIDEFTRAAPVAGDERLVLAFHDGATITVGTPGA